RLSELHEYRPRKEGHEEYEEILRQFHFIKTQLERARALREERLTVHDARITLGMSREECAYEISKIADWEAQLPIIEKKLEALYRAYEGWKEKEEESKRLKAVHEEKERILKAEQEEMARQEAEQEAEKQKQEAKQRQEQQDRDVLAKALDSPRFAEV